MEQAQVLTFKDTKAASLTLKSCGCSATSPFHCFGPAVRPYCLIHIIRNGKGIFQIDGKTYYLQKGQGFFIPPDVLTFYQADEKDPWEYLWVGFGGSEVPDILKQVGLSSEQPVFSCSHFEELYGLVNEMLAASQSGYASDLKRTGLLYQFLAALARDPMETMAKKEGEYSYIKKATEYIQNNYWNDLRIYDIAAYVNIDRSYLYLLFRRYLNCSPSEYLTRFRLTRASELLLTTTLSVESIALSCGYSDPATLSKAFKRLMGMSPSARRKKNQQT